MRNLSLQRGDAFILVYDVTNAETFEEVRRIRDDIHRVRQTNTVPIVVVGNKTDLADSETREVSKLISISTNSQSHSHSLYFSFRFRSFPFIEICLFNTFYELLARKILYSLFIIV